MHKVSEGKLNLMIESTDLAIAEGQFGVVLCADDVADALAELLDRRAAEREQAALEPRKLDEVTCAITVNPGAYEAAMAVAGSKIAEFIRAKQPKPRKPAKWQRRMREADIMLDFESIERNQWRAYVPGKGACSYADTAKAAVEAAWKAWKEERGE
jgi:dTDP-4-dehydrorhamnose reductase